MPKQKTRKAILKRFKVTKTGKVIHKGSFGRHLKASKNKARQRRQNAPHFIKGRLAIKLKKIMGY